MDELLDGARRFVGERIIRNSLSKDGIVMEMKIEPECLINTSTILNWCTKNEWPLPSQVGGSRRGIVLEWRKGGLFLEIFPIHLFIHKDGLFKREEPVIVLSFDSPKIEKEIGLLIRNCI